MLCLTFFCFGKSFSQNEFAPPSIIPPSPEASALFKFTETPVNLSQGMATTDIPIYTIKTKGVTIPISLSYHSRGIKVEEIASRVGLGWTLNYGGMISRQVRGKSDDGHPYGYLRKSYYFDFFTNETTRNQMWNDDLNHNVDFDPDLFFFSFPGYSGKFIFHQATKKPWQQKYSDIQISGTEENGLISSWTVKDDKGNIYYFGKAPGSTVSARDSETTVNKKTTTNGFAILPADTEFPDYNSWHLLKIVTYEKEVINFTYELEEVEYVRRSYDQDDNTVPEGAVCYYTDVSANQYQIKKIDFPGGWVLFNRDSNLNYRLDLSGSYALNNIQVYAKDGSPTGSLLSQHNFSYQTLTSTSNNNYHNMLAGSDGSSHKRMFLTSVTQVNGDDALPPYSFEYSSVKLPNRFSNSQDNWGYFNNANNGPFLSFFQYGNYPVDRRVDTLQNEAGLLKKVVYPTGGSVSYTYEQNVAVKPDFLDMTVSPGTNPVVAKSTGLSHLMSQNFDGVKFKLPVTIGENLQGSVKSSVSFSYASCQELQSTSSCGFPMALVNSSGTIFTIPYGNNISLSGISPGTYELQVYPPGGNPSIYFVANLHWNEEQPVVDGQGQPLMLASGKRIKKITYSDGQSTIKTKEYSYSFPNGANSGKIFGLPNFYSIMKETSIGNLLYNYGNKPGSPLTALQGNELGYGYVTEYEGTSTSNIGKTEYEYTNFSDEGTYYEFPYHLPIDNQWLRGKPLRTKIFKKTGSQYSLVKEVENVYLYSGTFNSPAQVGFQPIIHPDSTYTSHKDRLYHQLPLATFIPDDDQPDGHAYKAYYQLGGTFDLHSTTETSYLTNETGPQQVISTTTRNYDYPSHYQLKGTSMTSHGQTTEVVYNYPYSTSTLGSANRIIPIEKITSVKEGSTLVAESKQQTLFSLFGSLYLPSVIQSAKKGDAYQPRVEFTQYDSAGNPQEVSQSGGPTTVYIWGYDKQNPVAKIEGSTYAAVENLSAFPTGLDLGSGGLTSTQNSQLRTLPGALVTTYKYDPLVGITIVTDANGKTTTYKYDPFNRLEEVYNQDGHILKQINYHFKTSN